MKRYRLVSSSFDNSALLLANTASADVLETVREQDATNRAHLIAGIEHEFGASALDRKVSDTEALGRAAWSVPFRHRDEIDEGRSAFRAGNYRAALNTFGLVAERFLNMLVSDLRDEFAVPTQQLPRGWSSKWPPLIAALSEWAILDDTLTDRAARLATFRHTTAHRGVETDARAAAIEAHDCLRTLVEGVLGALAPTPWFIQAHPSEPFISQQHEAHPVVRHYFIPHSALVGPWHILNFTEQEASLQVKVVDDFAYQDRAVSDAEFIALRKSPRPAQ